jgi:hypothetical protein
MQKIPVSTDAHQIFKTTLNNIVVDIELQWQDASSSWFISVYDDVNIHIQNKRLNANTFILAQFKLRGFVGGIVAFSSSDTTGQLLRNSFLNDFTLYYLNNDELGELNAL